MAPLSERILGAKPPPKNLLVNGGCEVSSSTPGSVVGWTAFSCVASWSCANKPNFINPPQAGKRHFFAGPCYNIPYKRVTMCDGP